VRNGHCSLADPDADLGIRFNRHNSVNGKSDRKAFVASCVDTFLGGHLAPGVYKPRLFDGIDIDWESPQGKDAPNLLALLQEFCRQMREVRPDLLLSVAVDESPQTLSGTDFARIAPLVVLDV
jgi:chitinase